ncbi:MAG: hypothetical protein KC516_00370 [Nanoarchaeota archaeon]|nr:hypothetical protein [Nanoarchaeota archaeon]
MALSIEDVWRMDLKEGDKLEISIRLKYTRGRNEDSIMGYFHEVSDLGYLKLRSSLKDRRTHDSFFSRHISDINEIRILDYKK